ncbi:WXG100 family type VII secretion target [Nocardia sp. NPDC088792]|uniref:WXG100 family type VII secretion target n=1 Tax=Nocardia sp. NPDC088792 TaxID=3364332 RepID=UPI00380A152D
MTAEDKDDPTADRTGWPDLKEQAQTGQLRFTADAAEKGARAAADLVGELLAFRKILVDNRLDHIDQIGSQPSGLLLAQAFTDRGSALRDVVDIHTHVLTDMADTFRAAGKNYLAAENASKSEFDKLDSIAVPTTPGDLGAAPPSVQAVGGGDFPDAVKNFAGTKETITIHVESKESRLWRPLYDLGQAMKPDPIAEAGSIWKWIAGQLSDRLGDYTNTVSTLTNDWQGTGSAAAQAAVEQYAADAQPLVDAMSAIGANLTYTSEWMFDTARMMPHSAEPPPDQPGVYMPGYAVHAGTSSVAALNTYREHYDKYYATGVKNSASVLPVVPGPKVKDPVPPTPNPPASPPATTPPSPPGSATGGPDNAPAQPDTLGAPAYAPPSPGSAAPSQASRSAPAVPSAGLPPESGPPAQSIPASVPDDSSTPAPAVPSTTMPPGSNAALPDSGPPAPSVPQLPTTMPNGTAPGSLPGLPNPGSPLGGIPSSTGNSGGSGLSALTGLLGSLLGANPIGSNPMSGIPGGPGSPLGPGANLTQFTSTLKQLDGALQSGDTGKVAELLGLPKDQIDQLMSQIRQSPDKLDELAQLLGLDPSGIPGAAPASLGLPGGDGPGAGLPGGNPGGGSPEPHAPVTFPAADTAGDAAASRSDTRLFPRAGLDSGGAGGMAGGGAMGGAPMGGGAPGGGRSEYRRAKYLDSVANLDEAIGPALAKSRPVIEP